jgi:hypothetical protein
MGEKKGVNFQIRIATLNKKRILMLQFALADNDERLKRRAETSKKNM